MMDTQKQISVYRHELKYFINYAEYLKMKEILSRFMRNDSYANTGNGYFVRSLYFDTLYNKEYVEKIIGIEERNKIRLRIYHIGDENVKLEIKSKYNNYMKKDTTLIDRKNARRLVGGDKSFLLDTNNPTMNRIFYYLSLRYYIPAVIIDYTRDAFVGDFNNIRITFDMNIKSCASEFDLFRDDLHLVRVFDNATVVMEVKYNRFLPKWLKMILSCIDSTNSAISKYCYGRKACVVHM
jgi:hypothetical protein